MTKLVVYVSNWHARLRDREEGQALVEYALILALVSVVSILTLEAVGGSVNDILTTIQDALAGAAGGS
jgi:pilus assembly protein Flp/PilA